MVRSSSTSRGWALFIATLMSLGLVTYAFGFDLVGRLCLIYIPTNIAIDALRKGQFRYRFGRHELIRTSDPQGYWTAVVGFGLISAYMIWRLAETLAYPNQTR